jgi:hypothetical protein
MNKNTIIGTLILFLSFSVAYASENNWEIIADSSNIYRINTFQLKNGIKGMAFRTYGEINIPVLQTLKGEEKDNILLRLYLYEEYYNYISSLPDNTDAIIFLEKHYNPWGPNYGNVFNYYVTYDINCSIILYSDEYNNYLIKETELHNKIITEKLYENFEINEKVRAEILQLIDNLTNENMELEYFKKIEDIGEKGVPYIILALNDFRKLPIQYICLKNHSPDDFEAIRHYGPYLVVDALAAILGQITHKSFGFIYNGNDITDEERIETIKGWYIYLYYLVNK